MTKPIRTWLPALALCVWAGGMLWANEDPHKKKEEAKPAPQKTESPKPDAHKAEAPKKEEPKQAAAAPKPAPAAAPVRPASIRRPPVRRPPVARRTPPVTVTASPEPAAPAAPSTAVIHLVTHSADSPGAAGLPVPGEIARLMEDRERAERERGERERLDRERLAMEQSLAERERALAAREAALRKPEPEPPAAPVAAPRKRTDRNVLTNEGLVKLADAGYDEPFLMELIRRRPSKFDTTVDGLSYLMQAGLTQQLVRTVLAVEEWERARKAEEMAGGPAIPAPPLASAPAPVQPPMAIPAGMKEVRQKVMVPQGQLRAGERGVMMLAPSGERWYWVPDAPASR